MEAYCFGGIANSFDRLSELSFSAAERLCPGAHFMRLVQRNELSVEARPFTVVCHVVSLRADTPPA
jgi:hypothetical protein